MKLLGRATARLDGSGSAALAIIKPGVFLNTSYLSVHGATSTREVTLTIHNLSSGNSEVTLEGDSIEFNPQTNLVLVSKGNKSQLYELSGKALTEFAGGSAVFIPKQQRLLTTLDYGVTRLYDLSGNPLAEFPGSYSMVSPDGKFLITSLRNGEKRLWRVDNGLDDLLSRGCNWLQPYLKSHPEDLKRLKVCQINK